MDAPDQFAWLFWATASPYSPLNLHHLPQPIPNDAPLELQDGTFTFEDAFEDLLHVVSGRRLMDINSRYQMRKMLHEMHPHGEDASFWIRRLHSQSLLDNSNFIPFSSRPIWSHEVWDTIHREFARAAEEARRAEDKWFPFGSDSEGKEGQRDGKTWPRHSLFDDLDRLFRSIENQFSGKRREKGENGEKEETGEEADTFDDLYSSLSSAFSQGAKSLNTLIKLAREGVTEIHKSSSHSSSWSSYDSTSGNQKGEKVEEKEEFTDEQGNLHVKRTVRTLDEEGREIGREVHVRIQSPSPNRENEQLRLEGSKNNPNSPDSAKDSKNVSDGNSGWFWK